MRSLTRLNSLIGAVLLAATVFGEKLDATPPAQIWNQQASQTELSSRDARDLAPELMPAFRFQILYDKILSGAKQSDWRSELARFANAESTDPVSSGVRECARVWLARAEMEDIDALLLDYYAHNIHYPKTDTDFQKLLPAGLDKDPWGQPWVYSPQAPHGFSSTMSGQRYQLAPTSRPGIQLLKEAVTNRQELKLKSAVTLRDVAGHHALEFKSSQALTVIEPGGKTDSFSLLYVGDHWALMAGDDRLFAISF